MMKKVTILLLIISSFAFAGGEISFKKQNEKLRRLEDAKLESIRNNISDKQKGNVVNEENPVANIHVHVIILHTGFRKFQGKVVTSLDNTINFHS